MEKGAVHIEGMKNEQDVNKVLHAIKEVWGLRDVDISLSDHMATFSYDENAASYIDFVQAIKDTGFNINEKRGNNESM